tara:strand:+ start:3611 stop:3877 length:267 start_codon:yes stop_codon:yes gene_type:complete
MKYVLVDKDYNITTSVDLASNVGLSGAKTYFIGTKRIDEKNFDKLWKVMTEKEYKLNQEAFERKPSSHPGRIDWWKEDKEIIDDELKL